MHGKHCSQEDININLEENGRKEKGERGPIRDRRKIRQISGDELKGESSKRLGYL